MSSLSINNLWDKISGKSGIQDGTTPLLQEVANAMVQALEPCTPECVIIHHATHYTIGCNVPKDTRITLEQMYAGPKVCRTQVKHAWVEWNKKKECFILCCKVLKSKKRKRDVDNESDDLSLSTAKKRTHVSPPSSLE